MLNIRGEKMTGMIALELNNLTRTIEKQTYIIQELTEEIKKLNNQDTCTKCDHLTIIDWDGIEKKYCSKMKKIIEE